MTASSTITNFLRRGYYTRFFLKVNISFVCFCVIEYEADFVRCVLFVLAKEKREQKPAPATDRPQYCAIAGSWEKSIILYAIECCESYQILPIIRKTVIFHFDKRNFARQRNHFCLKRLEILGRKQTTHNQNKTEKMSIIDGAIGILS